MINVLIVDDSLTTRRYLTYLIEQDSVLHLAAEAKNGREAVSLAASARPDVIIMDIQMPGMDGYIATRTIMETNPVPIVMHSCLLAPEQAENIFEAMQAGAVAVVEKPAGLGSPESRPMVEKLLRTVKLMAEVKVVRRLRQKNPRAPLRPVDQLIQARKGAQTQVIAIGASTGGPPVLQHIFSQLPADFPIPITVSQHIAAGFLPGMLHWLAKETPLSLTVAKTADRLQAGSVVFSPEEESLSIAPDGRLALSQCGGRGSFKRPITHLFQSVARSFGPRAVGILLTGMGSDGAAGLKEMQSAGARTLAQDRETSTVFGMPAEAIKLDAVQYVLSPAEIAEFLKGLA